MSIERHGSAFTPICDYCGKELPDEYEFYDAVDARKRAGWHSVKDENEEWGDYCDECWSDMHWD